MSAPVVRLLVLADLEAYGAHEARHAEESDRDGDPAFTPYDHDAPFELEAYTEATRAAWAMAPGELGWQRVFGVIDGDRVVGHLKWRGTELAAARHRVGLEMGLERGYRRRGLGQALFEAATAWLIAETEVEWVDLGVFAENAPARALYRKLGFIETGAVPDRFRVNGRSIDDVGMVYRVLR